MIEKGQTHQAEAAKKIEKASEARQRSLQPASSLASTEALRLVT